MWEVTIIKKRKSSYSDVTLTDTVTASFEEFDDAKMFAKLALQGVTTSTVTMTCIQSNYEMAEKEDN